MPPIMASDMARNVNNALAESAKLLQRSAEKFSQTFEPDRGAQDEAIDLGREL